MTSVMHLWTVYDHPSDYPESYVARKWLVRASGPQPTQEVMTSPSLDKLQRDLQRRGLSRLDRMPDDDPKILETWL